MDVGYLIAVACCLLSAALLGWVAWDLRWDRACLLVCAGGSAVCAALGVTTAVVAWA